MYSLLKNVTLGIVLMLTGALWAKAQSTAEAVAYEQVAMQRATKIVTPLNLTDPRVERVTTIIARQYQTLNTLHEQRKKALADQPDAARKATIEASISQQLAVQHQTYLDSLGQYLSAAQIEQVKDGMTYGVVPITYKGYQAMLPNLTDEQKKQILAWLIEARERAMDEGTSEKKHAMFGKYKGRINNYLSAAGIDMKKASKEWEARIAREAGQSPK